MHLQLTALGPQATAQGASATTTDTLWAQLQLVGCATLKGLQSPPWRMREEQWINTKPSHHVD